VPYALPTIRRLAKAGHNLFIISRRFINSKEAIQWLDNHGMLEIIPKEKIAFAKVDEDKALYAKKFDIDIFMDDQTRNLSFVQPVAKPVLFNNYRTNINHAKYSEVSSWREFFEFVQTLRK
jgi:hypothetical protein